MSETDDAGDVDADALEDVPNRVLAFHYAAVLAIDKAESLSSWSKRLANSDVQELAAEDGVDLPDRTVRRATQDAGEIGWLKKKRQRWRPGDVADEYAEEPEETPHSSLGRANPDDKWHLMKSRNETMCGAELDYYSMDSDGERKQWTGFEAPDIHIGDLCRDCLGFR